MKQTIKFVMLVVLCLTVNFSFSQATSTQEKKEKPYRAWVKPIDELYMLKGYLSEVGDTLIVMHHLENEIYQTYQTYRQIRLDKVDYLKFRRKGEMGKSAAIGGAVGLLIGATVGLLAHEPCPPRSGFCLDLGPGVSTLSGGVLGMIPGLIIGGIAGGTRIKIPIKGSNKSIEAQKKELLKYEIN